MIFYQQLGLSTCHLAKGTVKKVLLVKRITQLLYIKRKKCDRQANISAYKFKRILILLVLNPSHKTNINCDACYNGRSYLIINSTDFLLKL